MRLVLYQFEVIHRLEKLTTLADGLSRFLIAETEGRVANVNIVPLFFLTLIEIRKLQQKDKICGPVIKISRDPQDAKFHTKSLFHALKKASCTAKL